MSSLSSRGYFQSSHSGKQRWGDRYSVYQRVRDSAVSFPAGPSVSLSPSLPHREVRKRKRMNNETPGQSHPREDPATPSQQPANQNLSRSAHTHPLLVEFPTIPLHKRDDAPIETEQNPFTHPISINSDPLRHVSPLQASLTKLCCENRCSGSNTLGSTAGMPSSSKRVSKCELC